MDLKKSAAVGIPAHWSPDFKAVILMPVLESLIGAELILDANVARLLISDVFWNKLAALRFHSLHLQSRLTFS